MSPADHYQYLLTTARLHEDAAQPDFLQCSEHEIQARWFSGGFGRDFVCAEGKSVRVVQFGVWNREAGPDFAEAAVSFDGAEPVRGCIEIDPDARDWERHGHAQNAAYENVVLHVFLTTGDSTFFTRTAQHRHVPQVLLKPGKADDLLLPEPTAKPGLCLSPLRSMSEERVREVILGAAHYRVRKKAAAIARSAELHGPDEALYQALAATLGYKSNKLPFSLIAQRLPLRLLRAARDDATALLFGVAGFLDQHDLSEFDKPTRAYLRSLWERWWPRRIEFERLCIPAALWKMSGQRPANHPQRRLAALAQLVSHWSRLRTLSERCEPDMLNTFFAKLHDSYWEYHYTVSSKPSAKLMALIGESRITEMLANVFLPLAVHTHPERWSIFNELPAKLTNQRVKTAALRLFGEAPIAKKLMKYASMQQGLLQIYEDFCQRDNSDCQRCTFPKQLMKW
jgi:hypothetical protein